MFKEIGLALGLVMIPLQKYGLDFFYHLMGNLKSERKKMSILEASLEKSTTITKRISSI